MSNYCRSLCVIALALTFAIPAVALAGPGERCSSSTQECLDYMAAHFQNRGWVGIEIDSDEEGRRTVTRVVEDSPAQAAGFQVGDVLLGFNGVRFGEGDEEAIRQAKARMHVGAEVTYLVERRDSDVELSATLAAVPDHVLAGWVGHHMLEHATVAVADADGAP